MNRDWKLGTDLHTSDDILSAITFEDILLALENEKDFVLERKNRNTAFVKKIFRQMLNEKITDAMFLIENNMEEMLKELFPEEYFPDTKSKPLTNSQCEKLAYEIYSLFLKNGIWQDVRIYFNGKALSTSNREVNEFRYNGDPFILEDIDPKDFFDYVHEPNIISMSFEGPVYEMFNYGGFNDVLEKFDKLIKSYGMYYELGNAWNLSLFE